MPGRTVLAMWASTPSLIDDVTAKRGPKRSDGPAQHFLRSCALEGGAGVRCQVRQAVRGVVKILEHGRIVVQERQWRKRRRFGSGQWGGHGMSSMLWRELRARSVQRAQHTELWTRCRSMCSRATKSTGEDIQVVCHTTDRLHSRKASVSRCETTASHSAADREAAFLCHHLVAALARANGRSVTSSRSPRRSA